MTRVLDVLISASALLLFLPFGLIISLLLRFTGEGEVFYRQQRIGRDGRPFGLLKFATMLKDSPALGTGDVTVKNDPRVLPVGRVLRMTKLNEIPQLLNVLMGDMSIVGPRPQTPRNFRYFPEPDRAVISSMRPGLTGIGSIVFRDEESIVAASDKPLDACYRDDIGPYKAELEKWYRERRGLRTYLLIIFVTAWVILRPSSQVYRSIWPSLPQAPVALRGPGYGGARLA
jgi:lipopolysaccharide/colanic/teichoic acid biosynthesis glycosyltransferase